MRQQKVCNCGRTFQLKLNGTHRKRCATCSYRRDLEHKRLWYRKHAEELRDYREFVLHFERDKYLEVFRLSQRAIYRRYRRDPVKLAQVRKYQREYKRFFPQRFDISDEVTTRDSAKVAQLADWLKSV